MNDPKSNGNLFNFMFNRFVGNVIFLGRLRVFFKNLLTVKIFIYSKKTNKVFQSSDFSNKYFRNYFGLEYQNYGILQINCKLTKIFKSFFSVSLNYFLS